MSSSRSGPPPQSDPGEAPSSSSDERASDTSIQRVTLPAAVSSSPSSSPTERRRFASGRSLTTTESGGEERVEVRASDGALLITLRLTDEGPILTVAGASIEIGAAKKLSLRAETMHLAATGDLSIEAGGGLFQRAGGSSVREIAGLDRATAGEIEIEVHPGGISMRANDDVDIVGERVRLNSDDPPMPRTWEEHRARHALPADIVDEMISDSASPASSERSPGPRDATLPDATPSGS